MTFNTQHCMNYQTKEIDYDKICNLIKKYDIDIIGLNEIYGKGFDRSINTNQAQEIANRLGYYSYFAKACNLHFKEYGNAIISKYPINDPVISIIKKPFRKTGNKYYEQRNILKVKIKPLNLNICITHFGLNEDEQINALKACYKYINNYNFILMGDFNLTPESKILFPLKESLNNTDIDNRYTYPSDKPNRKIDYIFTSKDINIMETIIPNEIISDHLPVITKIEIKPLN